MALLADEYILYMYDRSYDPSYGGLRFNYDLARPSVYSGIKLIEIVDS